MRLFQNARRAVLLILCLLSACAAADPSASTDQSPATVGTSGSYLAGRFEMDQGDYDVAASDLLQALSVTPDDSDLTVQTFLACLNAGRPEAVKLAQRLPANQIAQM